jgi:hypothetical protein
MDRLKAAGFSGNLLAFIFNLVSLRELEANRHNRNGISEVEKIIQSIEIYLKESGLEIAPKKIYCVFFIKKRDS